MRVFRSSGMQPRRQKRIVGLVLVGFGLLLLGLSGGYYAYAAVARSGLEDLNYVVSVEPRTEQGPTEVTDPFNRTTAVLASQERMPSSTDTWEIPISGETGSREAAPTPSAGQTGASEPLDPRFFGQIYPGPQIEPRYWANPMWAGPPDPELEAVKAEAATYSDLESVDLAGGAPPATRIRVPAIGVDSKLKELEIIDLGDSRAWETPNRVVGHIPTTATPGQQGHGWYFGHLESPIRGEGNVFQRLPDIPGLLRQGERVYVFLDGPDGNYLYEVYKTEVVHDHELQLTDSGKQEITLVACVPTLVYDHRILVTATLVGVKGS